MCGFLCEAFKRPETLLAQPLDTLRSFFKPAPIFLYYCAKLPNISPCLLLVLITLNLLLQLITAEEVMFISLSRRVLCQTKRLVSCLPQAAGSKVYATIDLEGSRVGHTRAVENELHRPQWHEFFHIYCAHLVSNVIFTIKCDGPDGALLIGKAYVPVEELIYRPEVDGWLQILDEDYNPLPGGPKVHAKLQFFNVTKDPNWSQGIRSPEFEGVPFTFFKQRQGCSISFYQDAHCLDDIRFRRLDGKYYVPGRCWEDIFNAIYDAKHLIYIIGWSIDSQITLIRDPRRPKSGGHLMLGELLKKKGDEGVRVLMLLWDDRSSVDSMKKDSLRPIHNQETRDYFRDTNVHCILCPRNLEDGRSTDQVLEASTMFAHHQKTIVVDSEVAGGELQERRIVSFIGGIDLCGGRYDTPCHSLFKTLGTMHHDDFHQPNFADSSIEKGGPREPWHDIHCRLEGPVAWDVLTNFEQRWRKQVGDDKLIPLTEFHARHIHPSAITSTNDNETWNIQLFRSIDGGAAFGFSQDPREAAALGLVNRKNNVVDRSIQDAYIHAIRRAKSFIYIETQYFLGSSFGWKSNDFNNEGIGALHLIPKELSLKIVSKIKAKEHFIVYIVIPMWPEGAPESDRVQAILDWQRRTMEMMYSDIAHALKGSDKNFRDYLTFFCLGNRETRKDGEYRAPGTPEPDTNYIQAQQSRRFMIYVHANIMIVDDEYIILGSANMNQRSMDGGQDSEIAIGCYQPYHIATQLRPWDPVSGQVLCFRMSLWREHLGVLDRNFLFPGTGYCCLMVNDRAKEYWNLYSSVHAIDSDMPGHLLRYPIDVTREGEITSLPGFEFFPDTKARVLGTKSDHPLPIFAT